MQEKPCVIDCQTCETFSKHPERCELCTGHINFVAKKQKPAAKLRTQKKSNRMGAGFEDDNDRAMKDMVKAVTDLTPNSGAGHIKGDEQINGIIAIMEELKTAVVAKYSRGALSFTLHKDWLTKLEEEARAENKEFWYLKFKFLETDDNTYVIVGQDIINAMVATMIYDRKEYKLSDAKIDVYKTKFQALESKLLAAEQEAKQYKAEAEYYKQLIELEKKIL